MGRGPDGYDCWGIVIEVRSRLGLYSPDYPGLSCSARERILQEIDTYRPEFERVDKPEAGDIILYKRIDGGLHFGVVVDYYHFIHCAIDLGVRRQRFDHPVLRQLIDGFYRCKS